MNAKEKAWIQINAFLLIGLGLPTFLLVQFHESVPTWAGIAWAVSFITAMVTFFVLLAFGPNAFRSRFPATRSSEARMILSVLAVWTAGMITLPVVDDVLPEWGIAIYGLALLGIPWAFYALSSFGVGPWGRALTETAKQDERESWRN